MSVAGNMFNRRRSHESGTRHANAFAPKYSPQERLTNASNIIAAANKRKVSFFSSGIITVEVPQSNVGATTRKSSHSTPLHSLPIESTERPNYQQVKSNAGGANKMKNTYSKSIHSLSEPANPQPKANVGVAKKNSYSKSKHSQPDLDRCQPQPVQTNVGASSLKNSHSISMYSLPPKSPEKPKPLLSVQFNTGANALKNSYSMSMYSLPSKTPEKPKPQSVQFNAEVNTLKNSHSMSMYSLPVKAPEKQKPQSLQANAPVSCLKNSHSMSMYTLPAKSPEKPMPSVQFNEKISTLSYDNNVKGRSMSDIINIPASRLRNIQKGVTSLPDSNNNISTQVENKNKEAALVEQLVEAEEKARASRLPMSEATCLCDRPKTDLLCRACGYVTWGRVRRQCLLHCRVSYLLDIEKCPRCSRKTLVEVEKSPKKE